MKSILYDYTPQELQTLLNQSNGYADVLGKVGLNPKGRNPETLKKIIAEYNLDTTQLEINRSDLFSKNAYGTHEKCTYELEDILNNKYPKYQSSKLLSRLIKEGYKKYECEICGINEWMNKPISFHLHHKDGNHNNNNLENLQVLCPNCHSQTDSYGGKSSHANIKEKHRDKPGQNKEDKAPKGFKLPPIKRSKLKDLIRNYPFAQIAKEYKVTDNAVRKWCDKYGLPRTVKVIRKYSDEEWETL